MKMVLILFTLSHALPASAIHVFAINDKSEVIEGEISPEIYGQSLNLIKRTLDDKVVSVLPSFGESSSLWQLQKFSLGVGLTGEIGLGPYKFGNSLKQRFVYTR